MDSVKTATVAIIGIVLVFAIATAAESGMPGALFGKSAYLAREHGKNTKSVATKDTIQAEQRAMKHLEQVAAPRHSMPCRMLLGWTYSLYPKLDESGEQEKDALGNPIWIAELHPFTGDTQRREMSGDPPHARFWNTPAGIVGIKLENGNLEIYKDDGTEWERCIVDENGEEVMHRRTVTAHEGGRTLRQHTYYDEEGNAYKTEYEESSEQSTVSHTRTHCVETIREYMTATEGNTETRTRILANADGEAIEIYTETYVNGTIQSAIHIRFNPDGTMERTQVEQWEDIPERFRLECEPHGNFNAPEDQPAVEY